MARVFVPRGRNLADRAPHAPALRASLWCDEGRKVETSVEARAGFLDRPVLIVLCVSLALALVGALWLGFFTTGA
jgi:hypothetical protein